MNGKIDLDKVLSNTETEIIFRADLRRVANSISSLEKFDKEQLCKRLSISVEELNSVLEFSEKLLRTIKERTYNA